MATFRPLEDESFQALADELASMTTIPHVLWLIERMTAQYDELDQANTDLLRECRQHETTAQTYETKLDDISATFDAMQTGFRDLSDLARTIHA